MFEKFKMNFFNKNNPKRYTGFTLAEVLITLGIIGIVAAITIPNLVNNTRNMEYKTAAKTAYADLSAAVKLAYEANGDLDQYIATSGSFYKVLIPYLNVEKDYGMNGIANGFSTIYKAYPGTKDCNEVAYGRQGQFTTVNGMSFFVMNYQFLPAWGIWITVDVNGHTKKPNISGVDVFTFQVLHNNLVPMGAPGTHYEAEAATYCDDITTPPHNLNGMTCALKLFSE